MSLSIYLFHTYIVTVLRVIIIKLNLCANMLPIIIIHTLLAIMISYMLGVIISSVPVIKYLLYPVGLIDNIHNAADSKKYDNKTSG